MKRTITTATIAAMVLSAGVALAADPVVACQQAKLKATGKLQSCLNKSAAGVLGGKDDVSAECRTKFTEAIAKADTKAASASASCRMVDNGDGTVSDLDTGLMWEKKTGILGTTSECPGGPQCGDPHDVRNRYQWGFSSAPDRGAFTEFLGQLNGGKSSSSGGPTTGCFAGHCDWRLPTIEELKGLVDMSAFGCGSGNPCIDPLLLPTQTGYHWSSSTAQLTTSDAWFVYFVNGYSDHYSKTFVFAVRAVRTRS